MKASEMTNEELANELMKPLVGSRIVIEAAARLRWPTPVDDDLLKMARDIEKKDAEIAKLRTLTTRTDNSEVIAELQRRLEAVVKMASESRISREVKNRGFRLYVEIDDFKMDLDMGDVAKSLNSIDAILRVASGEGGAK